MTDDKQTPPDWAFERAQELRNKRGFTHLDAFAAYIAEHEQPPVDRKLLCAREAKYEIKLSAAMGHRHTTTSEDIAVRAIELFEQGFGE